MIHFSQYLEEKNTHLEHAEDFVLNDGYAGAKRAIQYMAGIVDSLSGHAKKSVNLTVKYDGAPTIVCGVDPVDGKFFVGTKRAFNKEPVLWKNEHDIPDDDLGAKLKIALRYLSKLGIKNVIQGDFMFTHDTLKRMTFDGVEYLTFHPNTIIYAVPNDSELAKRISKAKMGIVWHTTYSGSGPVNTLKASGGKQISRTLKQTADVWHDDVLLKNQAGTATFTQQESKDAQALVANLAKRLESVDRSLLDALAENSTTVTLIKQYMNQAIRSGESVKGTDEFVRQTREFLSAKLSEKGNKDPKERKPFSVFAKYTDSEIRAAYELMAHIVEVKKFLMAKLDSISSLKTFIGTTSGDLRVTGHEGYVISDMLGGNAMKLVDRIEFSRANFSPETLKGFAKG